MKENKVMEFRDLKIQYKHLKVQINDAIIKVCSDSRYISGTEVKELEEQLAEYIGTSNCITCGNGTDAIILSLMAWEIGKGDAVFVPDFTFFASGEAPAFLGATPVFVDVEKDTFNISVQSLESAIKAVLKEGKLKPRAVIAVDLFGQPANYNLIKQVTNKYNLLLLEDGAQGFGGAIGDKMACSFGDISVTSFFPAKPLGCYGDGGAVFTDNDIWAEKIRSLCVHGKGNSKYDNICIGMNSRLDTIQAAILQIKFNAFIKYELENSNNVAMEYTKLLSQADKIIVTPHISKGYLSGWAQYTIICKDKINRENIQSELNKYGIPSMVYYAKGLHEQTAFKNKTSLYVDLKNTGYLTSRVLSLPMHPYMDKEQIKMVCDIILNTN
jgi:dTDP-4-amino-4,6-dideoxygalactose transaminase